MAIKKISAFVCSFATAVFAFSSPVFAQDANESDDQSASMIQVEQKEESQQEISSEISETEANEKTEGGFSDEAPEVSESSDKAPAVTDAEKPAEYFPVIEVGKPANLTIKYFDDYDETIPIEGAEFEILQIASIGTDR